MRQVTPLVTEYSLFRKTALLRVALDVPLEQRGGAWHVLDDRRIRATLETITYLIEQECRIVLLSYLGRPGGKRVPAYSLQPIAERMRSLLGKPVDFVDFCTGPMVKAALERMGAGEILLLENTRFNPGEDAQEAAFADELAQLGEVLVFDAFAQAHRAQASTTALAKRLPTVFGFSFKREIENLSKLLEEPSHPFTVIMGGVKVADKAAAIGNLARIADHILIGGALAHPFLQAAGVSVGTSFSAARETAAALREKLGDKLQLPFDFVAASPAGSETQVINIERGEEIPPTWQFVDIGPKTIEAFRAIIANSRTILWNGPLGIFEKPYALRGTRAVAEAIVEAPSAFTVAGGGETEHAIAILGLESGFSFVSTGGGALLDYLANGTLPIFDAVQHI